MQLPLTALFFSYTGSGEGDSHSQKGESTSSESSESLLSSSLNSEGSTELFLSSLKFHRSVNQINKKCACQCTTTVGHLCFMII